MVPPAAASPIPAPSFQDTLMVTGLWGDWEGGEAHPQPLTSAPSRHRQGREKTNLLIFILCKKFLSAYAPSSYTLHRIIHYFTAVWSEGSLSECCPPLAGGCRSPCLAQPWGANLFTLSLSPTIPQSWRCMHAKSLVCPTLCDPMDYNLPGFSVRGILQARIPEWVAMPSSKGSSPPRDQTRASCISCIGRWVLYH